MFAIVTILMLGSAAADPFDALVERALGRSPAVQAMEQQARGLQARAETAGAWPDPVFSVEASNARVDGLSLSDHPMSGVQLRLQQTLRPPGVSRRARATAIGRATELTLAQQEVEAEVRRDVRQSAWQLTRSRLLRDVTEQHRRRAEELLEAARSRYEIGAARQHEVLRLEVLRDRLSEDLADLDQIAHALTARLAFALGEPDLQVMTPSEVSARVPTEFDVDPSARPALQQLEASAATARSAAELARRAQVPDVTVWAGYRIRSTQTATDSGVDLVSVGVGLPLPINGVRRGSRAVRAEDATAAAALARRDALQQDIDMAVIDARSRWVRAHEKATRWSSSLIPTATAALQSARADYTVGRADFATLFEAETALLELERGWIMAAVETHLQWVELAAMLGRDPGVP